MSLPRQVIPGATLLLTRRTSQRQFLLRPAPLVNQIFEYCLAYAANRYAMQVHAWCVMSNHYHMVVTDLQGNVPAFMSWFNEFLAKSLNALHGRGENFFGPGSYNMVLLKDPEDILDKMVYTLVNPVRAGLVARSQHWPGSSSRRVRFHSVLTVARPNHFFRPKGPMPKQVEMTLERPPGFDEERDEDFEKRLQDLVEEREREIRQEAQREGRSFLGSCAALRIRPTDAPKTAAPKGTLKPRVAARNREGRREELARLKVFWSEYRRAWKRWREGDRNAVFPYGTYQMRLYASVESTAPP